MSFRPGLLLLITVIFQLTFNGQAAAQQEATIYKGLRISLFAFEVLKQKPDNVSLRLQVVNTGRLPVSFGRKGEKPPESLVVELDTLQLPAILQGRENLVSEAVRNSKVELKPGEMQEGLKLDIKLKPKRPEEKRNTPEAGSPEKGCANLVFDTAYIVEYTEESMRLHYIIRNAGNLPANLLGKTGAEDDNLAVNVYFISGNKLTRGAILADGTFIHEGDETLDGILSPDQVLHGELKISLKNRTQFAPNLLFELDPFLQINDCDRTNNTIVVKVEF